MKPLSDAASTKQSHAFHRSSADHAGDTASQLVPSRASTAPAPAARTPEPSGLCAVAAGVSPAVEPGILPGEYLAKFSLAGAPLARPAGGEAPPSAAGETPATTLNRSSGGEEAVSRRGSWGGGSCSPRFAV